MRAAKAMAPRRPGASKEAGESRQGWSGPPRAAEAAASVQAAGAALWVAIDWARGHFLGGFPWATLGYGLHLDTPLLGWTRLGGVYVLSFFAAAVGLALAAWWCDRGDARLRELLTVVGAVVLLHPVGAWLA